MTSLSQRLRGALDNSVPLIMISTTLLAGLLGCGLVVLATACVAWLE